MTHRRDWPHVEVAGILVDHRQPVDNQAEAARPGVRRKRDRHVLASAGVVERARPDPDEPQHATVRPRCHLGTQSDQPGEWTIQATIVGGPAEQVGTISYPSLECGGVLLLRSAGANWLEVDEDITYGPCEDQGIITLTPTGEARLRYDWRQDGNDATATGALTRVR